MEKRQIKTDGGTPEVTANVWEKYGKKIVYFNDANGKRLASWDVQAQTWKEQFGPMAHRPGALLPALTETFSDLMEIPQAEAAKVEEKVTVEEKPFMPWLGENNSIARPQWNKASAQDATQWLKQGWMKDGNGGIIIF
jgi:hypothetical protein